MRNKGKRMALRQSRDRISGKRDSVPVSLVRLFVLATGLFLVRSAAAQTVTFTELYPFNSSGDLSDGAWPEAGLTRDAAGNLYGTTFFGGTGSRCDIYFGGCGTVFKLDTTGAETVLHSFGGVPDGSNPTARVILDVSGNLYGTTAFGGGYGHGTVFKVNAITGAETILHSFRGGADGANPNAEMVQDAAGNFYGTTQYGGQGCYGRGCGTVFEVSSTGQETILHRFSDRPDGASPLGGLALDSSGNIYGTTWLGGVYSLGTVFSLDSSGHETTLHSFAGGSDGANPMDAPVLDQAGNLYGTTSAGGLYFGSLFMVDTSGNESILYSFTGGPDGAYPYSHLLVDASGNLFGTASQGGCCGPGTVFEFSAGTLIPLYEFSAAPSGTNPDGQIPMGGLIRDSAGNLYGTATEAGAYGWGAMFELELGSQSRDAQSKDNRELESRSDLPNTRFISAASSGPTSRDVGSSNTAKLQPICNPTMSSPVEVATSHQRYVAGTKAQPPLTDSFDWPDGQLAALKTDAGTMFFSIDAGLHKLQPWHGHSVGNNNSGSVVRTIGTLDNPLGSARPIDVVIDHNPDPKVNPHNCDPTKYPHHYCYTYIGGGPVYQVPPGQVGAGNWLLVYHAEYDNPAYYLLGLAISPDKGLHWTDIGEIIRFNMPFRYKGQPAPGAIGDPPLVVSPDGKYFYVYFLDWLKSGVNTTASIARAPIAEVLQDAFGGSVHYAAPFKKYYQGAWDQPGIGGASTDLIAEGHYGGGNNVAYNSYIHRYMMLNSDSQNYSYAESPDGLQWTDTIFLGMLGHVPEVAGYSGPIDTGDDPTVLGKEFYVYYTQFRGPWPGAQSVKRFTLSCR
jgi:uncharacterized repeat protein (TIGR03803 family)